MFAKLPIIGSPVRFSELSYGIRYICKKSVFQEFSFALSEFTRSKYVYLTNSGISSFYIILKMLKEKSNKKEVILPAYTAGSLVVGVIKAGLKPVLCDISLEDFNMDRISLINTISNDTLTVVCVHMFGIGMSYIEQLREKILHEIFMVEDCAQAMGTKIKGNHVGSFSDVSFFSFNRGKNLPVYGGGCIITNSQGLITNSVEYNAGPGVTDIFKVLAFSLATNRVIYGLGYPFISRFKEVNPPKDFEVKGITNFHAGLGLRLLKNMDEFVEKRYQNGMFLINELKEMKGITMPCISADTRPAFNRLPIVFNDLNSLDEVERGLWQAGIETSRMYIKPLHHMFNLRYKEENFPNASYFARHLLTLPVHPMVRQIDLLKIVEVIRKICSP